MLISVINKLQFLPPNLSGKSAYNVKVSLKFNKQEWFTLSFLLLSAFISGYYTFYANDNSGQTSSENWCAQIIDKSNTVKTKKTQSLAWKDARKNSFLSTGDHIYTHEHSQATIQLRNRVVISMNENTLFTIMGNQSDPVLDLKKGIVYLQTTTLKQKISLKIKGKKFALKASRSIIKINNQKKDTKISVVQGLVKIGDVELSKQKEMTIIKNEKPKITFSASVPKPRLNLLSPQKSTTITLKTPRDSITLQWETTPAITQIFQVIIAKDKNFEKILVDKKTNQKQLIWVPGQINTFYWKVIGLDQNLHSKVYTFNTKMVAPPPPPNIQIKPQRIIIQHKRVDTSYIRTFFHLFMNSAYAEELTPFILLNWPKQQDYSYKIEIYKSRSMKRKLLDMIVKENSLEWINPPQGKVFWRMALVDKWQQIGPFSKLFPLKIEQKGVAKKETILPILKLLTPSHRQSLSASTKHPIHFRWTKVKQINNYKLLFSQTLSFAHPLLSIKTRRNSYSLPMNKLPKTTFFWRVTGVTKDKQLIKSKRRQIKILAPPHINRTPPKPKKKRLRKNSFDLALTTKYINYQQDGSDHSIHFNGITLSNFNINYKVTRGALTSLNTQLKFSSGKALDAISMRDILLFQNYAYSLSPKMEIAGGLGINYLTEIEENGGTLTSSDVIHYFASAQLLYKIFHNEHWMTNTSLSIGAGNIQNADIHLSINYLSRYHYVANIGAELKKFDTKSNDSVTQTSVYLSLGMQYSF